MIRYDFSGQVAVVTGGAQGIGKAIAEGLGRFGAVVRVWDLEAPESEDLIGQRVDVTDPDGIAAARDGLLAEQGRIDILVNCAGIAGSTRPVVETDPAEWRRVVEVNLFGVYHVSRLVVPVMQTVGRGRIVNVASLAGKEGTPNASAYSAAKAGVIAFTKSLGKELAATNIRVNAIAPAAVKTAILDQMAPAHVETMIAKSPMQRLGRVEEVAALTLWLCSEACSFNSGAVFDLSGGRATY
ncbi:MAG: SDR family NAD(P)-dependent oxidoreductase [Kiloniellales bacterium]|nr:SDR family NAD(P)-dependent oxidoreductase [Kiloniellales bacterium]